MTGPRLRAIKLGGSLLDLADWPARFNTWLARQPAANNVLIVGGGSFADAVRRLDVTHHFDEPAAHWLCIQAMSLSAALAAALLPGSLLRTGIDALELETLCAAPQILDVLQLLQAEHREGQPTLPENWRVTSDSISAHVARRLAADELVLLKSAAPAPDASLEQLAAAGFVDPYFPHAAAGLNVRFANLRE